MVQGRVTANLCENVILWMIMVGDSLGDGGWCCFVINECFNLVITIGECKTWTICCVDIGC